MSRHYVNKILREASVSDDGYERYVRDPAAFIARYELTDAERAGFLAADYPALYRLGAHPFLLNAFVMMFAKPGDERAHSAAYRDSIAPYGRPPFDT